VTGEPLGFTKWGIGGKPKDPTQIYLKIYFDNTYLGNPGETIIRWLAGGESDRGTFVCEWDSASP
jgi:hypothetical protein